VQDKNYSLILAFFSKYIFSFAEKNYFSMRLIALFFFFFLALSPLFAQTDTEFWFAAPEVSYHIRPLDRPVYLRFASYEKEATIVVSQPANPNFQPIEVYIASYSFSTLDLTGFIDIIETKPPNQVLNTGLRVQSSSPISCYYELSGSGSNPDIFTLKGQNALGKTFFVPGQTQWPNYEVYDPLPKNSFDIVATENNTGVTILPQQAIIGHPAMQPFQVVLQKGQTFSATARGLSAAEHLAGSYISATKPVAVTVKDDLLRLGSNFCADIAGDQAVPLEVLGTEYIAIRGSLMQEFVFFTATVDNTTLSVNQNPTVRLDAGETYSYALNEDFAYFSANQPITAFHLSGNGCEMAGAVLPALGCAGSRNLQIVRSTDELFSLHLIVKQGGESHFTINGNTLSASAFQRVQGTPWMAARIFPEIPSNKPFTVENSQEVFHLGWINGDVEVTGCRYGFFSSFDKERVLSNLDTVRSCGDAPVQLTMVGDFSSYQWSTGETTPQITVTQSGEYRVRVNGECRGEQEKVFVVIKESTDGVFIPNVITPDQRDGKNDLFKLPDLLEGVSLRIFDRWGKEVFTASPYQNNWAAENEKGSVFYYHISHTSTCLPSPIKGIVNVIKQKK